MEELYDKLKIKHDIDLNDYDIVLASKINRLSINGDLTRIYSHNYSLINDDIKRDCINDMLQYIFYKEDNPDLYYKIDEIKDIMTITIVISHKEGDFVINQYNFEKIK